MKRREFITGVIGGSVALASQQSFARDCGILNGRIIRNARSMVGLKVGAKYDNTIFASTVFAKSGAKPMWIGPFGNARWGREIDSANLNPGDILQFNGPAVFKRNNNVYFACDRGCTTIVLNRVHGAQPWSLLEVAYQYKIHNVRTSLLDIADYIGNFAIMFRPQL